MSRTLSRTSRNRAMLCAMTSLDFARVIVVFVDVGNAFPGRPTSERCSACRAHVTTHRCVGNISQRHTGVREAPREAALCAISSHARRVGFAIEMDEQGLISPSCPRRRRGRTRPDLQRSDSAWRSPAAPVRPGVAEGWSGAAEGFSGGGRASRCWRLAPGPPDVLSSSAARAPRSEQDEQVGGADVARGVEVAVGVAIGR